MTKEELIIKILGKDAKIEHQLMGGMMNESFVVSANCKKYVLYMPTAQANEMVDRKQEKDDQATIASLGITSKNVFFDTETGIKINEFIEGSSINHLQEFDISKVAKILKTLHNSGKKCAKDYNPFKRFVGYEAEANAFVKEFDEGYSDIKKCLFDNKDFLEKQEKVLCHNDYQRSNIIESTDKEYFMIDFEFTGNNDPIYDIGTFGNGKVSEGYDLLKAYYGEPTIEQKQRYYLWRMYISLQWYLVALVKHYRGEGKAHNMNFLDVASFFLENGKEAYKGFKAIQ